jgi:hypothetical protein
VVENAVEEDSPWEVVVEDAAVVGALSEFFDAEGGRDIGEEGVDPVGDGLPRELARVRAGFVHGCNNRYSCQLPLLTGKNNKKSNNGILLAHIESEHHAPLHFHHHCKLLRAEAVLLGHVVYDLPGHFVFPGEIYFPAAVATLRGARHAAVEFLVEHHHSEGNFL